MGTLVLSLWYECVTLRTSSEENKTGKPPVRKQMKKTVFSLLVLAAGCGQVQAGWISFGTATFSGGAGGTSIPDPDSGTLLPVPITSSAITVSGVNPATFSGSNVRVRIYGLSHSWSGDLVVTIQHVASGISSTVFSQIGAVSSGDFGYSADFLTAFGGFYDFYPGAPNSLWSAAAILGDVDFILDAIPGTPPAAVSYFPTGAGSAAGNNFAALTTIADPNGAWVLIITDLAAGPDLVGGFPDLGSVIAWEIQVFDPVPEPATIGLASLAVLALAAKSRWRRH